MFESLNAFVLSAILLLSGGTLCFLLGRKLGLGPGLAIALSVWHLMLGYFYSSYVLEAGGDAFVYYQKARFDFVEPTLGTDFIVWLASFPVSLGFSYWPLAFLFNLTGTVGLLFFCAALRETVPVESASSAFGRLLILLCCFLPSVSFWTSGIGKDAVSFLSVGMFLWSAMKLAGRQTTAIVAILIMLLVRPHIAALMVLSIAAGTIFVARLRTSLRFGLAAFGTAAAVFFVPLALVYSGSTRFASFADFVRERQEQNLAGGSSIDIVGMDPASRLLSYLYRPLPTEASDLTQLAASLDNLALIGLTAAGLAAMVRAGFLRVSRLYSIPLLYGLASLVVLSQVTANLGLAMRQKWMLVPAFMLVTVGAWSLMRQDAMARRQTRRRLPAAPQAVR